MDIVAGRLMVKTGDIPFTFLDSSISREVVEREGGCGMGRDRQTRMFLVRGKDQEDRLFKN